MKSDYSSYIIYNLWMLTLLLSSCVNEDYSSRRANQREAIFKLEITDGTGNTRSATDDGAISSVYILAFTDPESGTFPDRLRFAYATPATHVSGSTYKANLTTISGKKQCFVVLANYDASTLSSSVGDGYDTVLEKLTATITTQWPVSKDIPMFGLPTETGIEISNSTAVIPTFSGIKLLRMMAKIDVINGNKKTGAVIRNYNNFELTGVYVYKMPKSGYLPHKKNNLANGTNRVMNPWVPAGLTFIDASTLYAANKTDAATGNESVENLIYTFENKAFTESTWKTVTYLGIKGKYYKNGISSGAYQEKTYPVYIPELQYNTSTGEGEPKSNGNPKGAVLRNHHYIFTIGEVKEESIDFTARVVPWIEADQNIIFDGQYRLELSRRKLIVDRDEALDVSLNIETTYDRAGKDETPGTTPISITAPKGTWYKVRWADGDKPNENKRNLLISIDENDTGVERKDFITITSGNMNYVFEIKQLPDPWLYYKSYGALMDGDEYLIKASTAHFKEIEVKWTAEINETTNLLTGDRMMTQLLTKEGGGYTPVNPIHKEFFRYNATKSINEVPFEHVKFTVYDDWAKILAGSPGKTHKFVTVVFTPILDNPDYYLQPQSVEVLIASADLETRESNCYMFNLADSKVGGSDFKRATLFTVSRANNTKLKTNSTSLSSETYPRINNTFEHNILWTDTQYGIELRGNVSCVKEIPGIYNGTDYSGFIAVVPGARANGITVHRGGNTLVAAMNSNTIKWSWHLWVHEGKGENTVSKINTGYNNSDWMDRNIGALVNKYDKNLHNEDPTIYGLTYQYGRKDPFNIRSVLTRDKLSTDMIRQFYNDFGEAKQTTIRYKEKTLSMLESIQNPTVSVFAGDGTIATENKDHWCSEHYNISYLWNDPTIPTSSSNRKSIFDPCPLGWKINVNVDWFIPSEWSRNDFGIAHSNYGGYYPTATNLVNNSKISTMVYFTTVLEYTKSGSVGWRGFNTSPSTSLYGLVTLAYARCVKSTIDP